MSWSEHKNTIVEKLIELKYRQVSFNLTVEEAPENFAHKVFEFKFASPELNNATAGTVIKQLAATIRVGYIAESIEQYDKVVDDYQQFINTVAVNSNSFSTAPILTRIEGAESYYVGEMSVFIGTEQAC